MICSARAVLFESLDFSFKAGLEVNLGNIAKLGASFFKDLRTGETGASVAVKAVVGYEVGTKNAPGVPLNTPGRVTHTGSIGPFQRNYTTREDSVNVSLGLVIGIGGEVSFNSKRYSAMVAQCDIWVD